MVNQRILCINVKITDEDHAFIWGNFAEMSDKGGTLFDRGGDPIDVWIGDHTTIGEAVIYWVGTNIHLDHGCIVQYLHPDGNKVTDYVKTMQVYHELEDALGW